MRNEKIDRIPGSALSVSSLWSLALLGSRVSGPWAVVLSPSMTASTSVVLVNAIVLAAMATPTKRRYRFSTSKQLHLWEMLFHFNSKMSTIRINYLQPEVCWLSEMWAPMGGSGTTACPGLWMDMPGICCHVEGIRICCVPAGQPCCVSTCTQACWKTVRNRC